MRCSISRCPASTSSSACSKSRGSRKEHATPAKPHRAETALRASRASRSPTAIGYDLIVVDTAPTGHTLRLLAAPETVAAVAGVLDALQQEHRLIREQLARVGRPEAADRLIALLAAQARETAARLRDPRQTAFHWVTLPEELSLAESEDAIAALERAGMNVPEIVVNRVLPASARVLSATGAARTSSGSLAAIRRRLGRGRRVRVIQRSSASRAVCRRSLSLARWRWQLVAIGHRHQPSAISHQPSSGAQPACRRRDCGRRVARRFSRRLAAVLRRQGRCRQDDGRRRGGGAAGACGARRGACCCCRPIRRTRWPTCSRPRSGTPRGRIAGRTGEPGRPRAGRGRRARRSPHAVRIGASTRSRRPSAPARSPAPEGAPPS